MTDKPLRAGVIGLGIGRHHANGYLTSSDSSLVALCDANEERLEEMSKEYRVPPEGLFTDYKTMLEKMDLDIVSVCLPNSLHASVSIAALNAGAHVMCEKPMASTSAEAREMIATAERNNRRLMIAYNWRYRPDAQWMYKVVQNGRLGKVYHANVSWRRETGIPGWGWFGSKQMSGGGALIDLGVHVLDMALWMFGFPRAKTVTGEISATFGQHSMKTWGRRKGELPEGGFDVEDGAVGFIRLDNGANIVLQATWAEHAEPSEDRIRVELRGTEGTAILNIANYTNDDTLRLYTEIDDEPVTITPQVRWGTFKSGHVALIHSALSAVTNGTTPETDASQGLAAMEVLESLYESARTGHEIALEAATAAAT